ncbi:hypothetical protein BRADI_2g05065v3 [Brachypodium distachyon]|uniref:Uncharacterized protein n=1 Tax=Brachypodium distachyon TaxID=15368 RepID=A0A2K2D722_BRADI|nr:hypothetical protein BRADI_2g05065v3 [Brachypodium distachyon]
MASGDHGKDPLAMCYKVSVSLLATVQFIGSKSILVCECALPNLGTAVVRPFCRRCHGGVGGVDGWRFGEAQVSPRVEFYFYVLLGILCKVV